MESRTAGNGAVRFSGFDVPEFAVRFCIEMGCLSGLEAALRLAREHFPPAIRAVFEVVPGFGAGEKWLTVKIGVPKDRFSIAEVTALYTACLRALVTTVPMEERDPIVLSFGRL